MSRKLLSWEPQEEELLIVSPTKTMKEDGDLSRHRAVLKDFLAAKGQELHW